MRTAILVASLFLLIPMRLERRLPISVIEVCSELDLVLSYLDKIMGKPLSCCWWLDCDMWSTHLWSLKYSDGGVVYTSMKFKIRFTKFKNLFTSLQKLLERNASSPSHPLSRLIWRGIRLESRLNHLRCKQERTSQWLVLNHSASDFFSCLILALSRPRRWTHRPSWSYG